MMIARAAPVAQISTAGSPCVPGWDSPEGTAMQGTGLLGTHSLFGVISITNIRSSVEVQM